MQIFKAIGRTVAHVEDALLVTLLITLIGLGAFQIVVRNFGFGGPAWTEELVRILVLWLAMAGAMAASRSAKHISIDLVSRLVPPRARHAVAILSSLFTAAVSLLVAYYCLEFVKIEYEFGSKVLDGVAAWTVQIIMPVAFGVIALRYLLRSVTEAFAIFKEAERPEEAGS